MIIKKIGKSFLYNSFIVLLIFFIDRITKVYVIYLDKKNLNSEIFVSKYLNLHLIWNEGIAFGLLNFQKDLFYNLLTGLILIVILIIFFMVIRSEGIKKYLLIFILGGALGNIFDRIVYRGVPDFIDFHVGNFHWFIFNVSDIFITLGVIGMIFLELIVKRDKNVD